MLIDPLLLRYGLFVGSGIVTRERLLDSEELFEVAAFDEYIFLRNLYLQQRNHLIGVDTNMDDDFDDDFDDEYDSEYDVVL